MSKDLSVDPVDHDEMPVAKFTLLQIALSSNQVYRSVIADHSLYERFKNAFSNLVKLISDLQRCLHHYHHQPKWNS
jgi:hypothetical protein